VPIAESWKRSAARGGCKVTEPIIDPQYWRDCAWVARATADRVKDVRFKRIMLRIAEIYEVLAEGVEQRLLGSENQNHALALPIRPSCPPRLGTARSSNTPRRAEGGAQLGDDALLPL